MNKGKILSVVACLLGILFFVNPAYAALQNLGTDNVGNRLIYDTDLDVTWYDYSNAKNYWQNQVDWAGALSVNFGGNVYDDWRLPITTQPDPSCGFQQEYISGDVPPQGYGYNCTGSEMGHLYYTELGNLGFGTFTNAGDFQNLQADGYWSGTRYATYTRDPWIFFINSGFQGHSNEFGIEYGIAVRDGLAVVPEPISSILFLTGGTLLAGMRFLRRKR